jgi:hypothetical protein
VRTWWRRRVGNDDREAGFTLVDAVASFVIMGIVIAPLTIALVQAMNVIPSSGVRTHTATDMSRLQSVFTADVTQSQAAEIFLFVNPLTLNLTPAYPPDGNAPVTGPPAQNASRQWAMTNLNTWQQAPATAQAAWLACPPPLASNLASAGLSVPIFDVSWSDGVAATGAAKNPPDLKVTYKAVFTNDGSGARRVEIHRWVSTSGQPETDQGAYASGYCNKGEIVSWPQAWSKDLQQSGFDTYLWFRSTPTAAVDVYKITAAARPSGTNPAS